MLTFVLTTILVLTVLCAGVYCFLITLMVIDTTNYVRRRLVLPPPERQTERVYGQQYFDRAVGNTKK